MRNQIISILLSLQIFCLPFSQTVYAIEPVIKKTISDVEGKQVYHDHIVDSIDRPDIGYIQGVTFRGLNDQDKDLFYKLIINDKVIGTLSGGPISEDKKRYIDFKKYNNQQPLYAGDKIELYIGNNQNDSFKQKVFEFGNVNSIALNILTPESIAYFKDKESGELKVNIFLNKNVPSEGVEYFLVNLTKKEEHKMHIKDSLEGMHMISDGITIKDEDEYVILSKFEDVEYYTFKSMGQDIIGFKDNIYKIYKADNNGKVIGGKSNIYIETINEYSKEQEYYFEYDDLKGAYKIIQKFSGKKLIYSDKDKKIGLYNIDKDYDDQYWVLAKTKSGKYNIFNYDNKNIFLTIDNNNVDIVGKPLQDGVNQEFEFKTIKPNIVDSKYAILSVSNKNKVISIDPKTLSKNNNVVLSDKKSYYEQFQQFDFKYIESKGAYKLVSSYADNKVVTWLSSKNNNVSMYDDNEFNDQLWVFEPVSDGVYVISSLNDPNRVLNVDANGVNISVANRYNTTKQQFALKDIDLNIDGGRHLIKSSSNPSRVVSSNGNNVVLKDREEVSPLQEFTFKYIESKNAYQILNASSLDDAVVWASNSGNNVILYKANIDYDDQLWNFEKLDDNIFTIYNMHDKSYVLNIDKDGKNISVAKRNNSTNQKFLLERINTKVYNGNYSIRLNEDRSKVISNRYTTSTSVVLVDEIEDDKSQEFVIQYFPEYDAHKIMHVSTGLFLSGYNKIEVFLVSDASAEEPISNVYNQLWNFDRLDNGAYTIYSNYYSDYVLNIHKYESLDYTVIELAKRDGSKNQEFVLSNKSVKISDGDYNIQSNYNESKVFSGNIQLSNILKLEDKIEGSTDQIFSVKYIESKDAYQIIHTRSKLAVAWDSKKDNKIILYEANVDYNDQLWNFEKASEDNKYIISNMYNPSYVITTNNTSSLIHMALRKADIKQIFELK